MTTVRGERRLVTTMFVDIVGSTELTMRLGAERLKHELGKAFAEISGIITGHGGTVEKYVGDAIYALFGAPVAHEDDPPRALRAADPSRGATSPTRAARSPASSICTSSTSATAAIASITAPIYAALADGVREAVAEPRGGPPATFAALRALGLNGWAEILRRCVDAEY